MGNAVTSTAVHESQSLNTEHVDRSGKVGASSSRKVIGGEHRGQQPAPTADDRYSEERQFVNEVGRLLLALEDKGDGEGTTSSSSFPSPTIVNEPSCIGGMPDRDADLVSSSKSTGSTKGSPDWSLNGDGAGPEQLFRGSGGNEALRRGGGGALAAARSRTSAATSSTTRGVVTFTLHPTSTSNAPGTGTEQVAASSSSSLSKSPFLSRLMFRRAQQQHINASEQERYNDQRLPSTAALERAAFMKPSGGTITSHHSTNSGTRGRKSLHNHHQHQRSASARPSSARIPVGRRRSRHFYDRGGDDGRDFNDDDDHEEASELQLQQLYDLRTWDLYMRITEARQQKEQQKLQQQQQLWSHHIPHAQPYVEPTRGDDHPDTTTEPTSSPDSDYGWYDDFPASSGQRVIRAAGGAAGTSPSRSGLDHSHEFIFGDPEL